MAKRLLVVAILVLLALPPLQAGAGTGAAGPRAPGPQYHERNVTVNDFSNAPRTGLELTPTGGLRLEGRPFGPAYEQNVSFAQYSHCYPAIGVDSKNNYIVAWQGVWGDSSFNQWGIFSRRFDSGGNPLGPSRRATNSNQAQWQPDIAVNSTDYYVIAWNNQDGGIYARLFDPADNLVGGEVQVSSDYCYESVSIAVNSKDLYLIAWTDYYSADLHARMLDASGKPSGPQFSVCSAQEGQTKVDLAALVDNGFIAVWQDLRSSEYYDIYAQRLDPLGTNVGSEIQIPVNSSARAPEPRVAVNSSGAWMVVWSNFSQDYSSIDIYAQRFDASHNKAGEVMVLEDSDNLDLEVDLSADPKGGYILVWVDYTTGVYVSDIRARMFDGSGTASGNELDVCSEPGDQWYPVVAADRSGGFLAAWTDERHAPQYEIYGRRFGTGFGTDGVMTLPALNPASVWRWSNITADATLPEPSANSVKFEFSQDGGAAWQNVPQNGSLAAADPRRELRLKARLATANQATTPTLVSVTLNYILNNAPRLDLPGDFTARRNLPAELFATVSDQDGDELSLRWSQLGGPRVFLATPDCATLTFSPASSGIYSFRFSARDAYEEASGFVNVTVNNGPPTLKLPSEAFSWKLGTAVINASTDDPDGDAITVCWTQTAGTHVYFQDRTVTNLSFVATFAGDYTFRAVASDGEKRSEPAFVRLSVRSRPPRAFLYASAGETTLGTAVGFDASASTDTDGTVAGYNFSFGDGSSTGWTSKSSSAHSYGAPGSYNATVTVRDDDGNETTSEPRTVLVWPAGGPPLPTIRITSPGEGQLFTTANVSVTFSLGNVTIGPGLAHIHFQLDAEPEASWESSSPYQLQNLSDGRHALRALLENATHVAFTNPGAAASVNFTVGRSPTLPDLVLTVRDISFTPGKPKDGDTIILSATIRNTGGSEAGTFAVRFLLDGQALPEQTIEKLARGGSVVSQSTWKARPGTHTLKVVADPAGAIEDRDRTNNEASVVFKVAGSERAGQLDIQVYLALAAAIIVGAGGAAFVLRRKKAKAQGRQ